MQDKIRSIGLQPRFRPMTEPNAEERPNQKLRRTSAAGIFLGIAALIACELPIILALIGFGALSAAATALQPPFWMEVLAFVGLLLGIAVLVGSTIRQRRVRNGNTRT